MNKILKKHPGARNVRLDGYLKDAFNSWGVNIRYKYDLKETRQVFSHYSKGSYITDVESISRSEYPDNGEQGGYWYELVE